ncbi:hypothetical protein SORBI_3004G282301 [Sorghum bicolor]|uniref:Uncharacterized protein n=1 Tax=Sorghum bicolor TaxID=4558 RepID=A0A1Z5RPE7_SORBI|nr:hypothetical protein SORBI_3004G282301 [Sorghum bicolor]
MEPRKPPPATAGSEITGCMWSKSNWGRDDGSVIRVADEAGCSPRRPMPRRWPWPRACWPPPRGSVAWRCWRGGRSRSAARTRCCGWCPRGSSSSIGTPLIAWLSVLASGTASRPPADAAQPS